MLFVYALFIGCNSGAQGEMGQDHFDSMSYQANLMVNRMLVLRVLINTILLVVL